MARAMDGNHPGTRAGMIAFSKSDMPEDLGRPILRSVSRFNTFDSNNQISPLGGADEGAATKRNDLKEDTGAIDQIFSMLE